MEFGSFFLPAHGGSRAAKEDCSLVSSTDFLICIDPARAQPLRFTQSKDRPTSPTARCWRSWQSDMVARRDKTATVVSASAYTRRFDQASYMT